MKRLLYSSKKTSFVKFLRRALKPLKNNFKKSQMRTESLGKNAWLVRCSSSIFCVINCHYGLLMLLFLSGPGNSGPKCSTLPLPGSTRQPPHLAARGENTPLLPRASMESTDSRIYLTSSEVSFIFYGHVTIC